MIQAPREPVIAKAIKWIADELEKNPLADKILLIDRASMQFNLSPLQGEFLCRNLLRGGDSGNT